MIPAVDQTRSDSVHYDVPGYKAIGVRFAEAARELYRGSEGAVPVAVTGIVRLGNSIYLSLDRTVFGAVTVSYGYEGDSVVNSLSDIGFMALGFWLASKLPWWVSLGMAAAFELFTLVMIRDNLTLNVLMLVWPLEAIRTWQGGL